MPAPNASEWNALFQTYSICTLVLVIKVFVSNMIAADKVKEHLAEDKIIAIPGLVNAPEDRRRRHQGVCSNDQENIPLHLVVFWAAFLVQQYTNAGGNGKYETVALTVLIAAYTGLRLFHSLSYYYALQPWRTLSFLLSTMSAWGAVSLLVAAAFQVDTNKLFGAAK